MLMRRTNATRVRGGVVGGAGFSPRTLPPQNRPRSRARPYRGDLWRPTTVPFKENNLRVTIILLTAIRGGRTSPLRRQ